jgi:hypothetical protein
MSKLAFNERTKMIATHFNSMAVASIVAGVVLPALQGVTLFDGQKFWWPLILGFCFQTGFLVLSSWTLGYLEE